jgi:hypothetical protein
MAVPDQLAGLSAGRRESEPDEDVVEAALEEAEEVLAGHAVLAGCLVVVGAELLLQHLVEAAGLLLLAQLLPVLGGAQATAAVISGWIGTALDAALVGQAALALQEELLSLATALFALGSGIAGHP